MKIGMFYFTGSGNTELVAKEWKKSLENQSIEVELFAIEDVDFKAIDFEKYDILGFGYPIHAFNAPKIMVDFAKQLPLLSFKKRAFIFMVSGENLMVNNSSSCKLKRFLKRKNIFVESEYHYIMPYNMIFRHTELMAYKMFDAMTKVVPLDVKEYLDGKNNILKRVPLVGFVIWLLRIEQLFAPVNGKHFKIDSSKCIKCMKCVNNCPTKNIEFADGKFKFLNKCTACTRCSFNCPTDAFKIGLLNGWRVNKKYNFKKPDFEEVDKHSRYCKRSYAKYFKMCEEKIQNSQK